MKLTKNLLLIIISTSLIFGLIELAFYFTTGSQNYKLKLRNTVMYFNYGNEPIPMMSELPWPDSSLIVRVDDGPIVSHPYILGQHTIQNAFLEPKTALIYPKHVGDSGIFIVGGSAAFGYAYHSRHSFASILDERLKEKYPVVNAAQVGWSSGQLVPVVDRITKYYNPKAIILYTGNNEWVQWWHDGNRVFTQGYIDLYNFCSNSYTLSYVVYGHLMSLSQNANSDPSKHGGFLPHFELSGFNYALNYSRENFSKNEYEDWVISKQNYLSTFQNNLNHIIELCLDQNVEIYITSVPFSFKLAPAWKHPQPITPNGSDFKIINGLINSAITNMNNAEWELAETDIGKALELEPNSSVIRYINAVVLENLNRMESAQTMYASVREQMIGNLGSRLSINTSISQVADRMNVPLIDLQRIFEDYEREQGKYFNETLISDDCHPNVMGHRLIADSLSKHFER